MLLQAKSIKKSYHYGWLIKKKIDVLKDINISIGSSETVGLVGQSGSGKSTLGLILAGLLKPSKGIICYKDERLDYPYLKETRKEIQILFQHPEAVFNPKFKLYKSIIEPYHITKTFYNRSMILELIKEVGLGEEHLHRFPSELSGGELQRAAISRVVSLNPKVIILDEPTSMLDVITQAQIMNMLKAIQKRYGVSYLLITHDLDLIKASCSRVYYIDKGVAQQNK